MLRRNTILAKYYALMMATLIFFITIGIFSYQYLLKNVFPEQKIKSPIFIAKIIDYFGRRDKITGIKKYIELKSGMLGPNIELLDEQGHIIFSDAKAPSELATLDDLRALAKPYDSIQLSQSQ